MTDTDLRGALCAFYAALDPTARAEASADQTLLELGKAVYRALDDVTYPADDQALEAARLRVLAIIGTMLPVPTRDEMQVQRKERDVAQRRMREERRAALRK